MLSTFLAIAITAADAPDYVEVHRVLQAHCAGCHNDDDAQGDFNVASFASLSQPLSYLSEGPSLTPGIAETSQFYRYMAGLDEPRMPPEGDGDPVPEADLAIVRAWLDGGAHGPDGAMPDRTQLIVPEIASNVADDQLGVTAVATTGRVRAIAREQFVTVGDRTIELPGRVNDLAFSADGSRLAIASGVEGLYGLALLIDAASGEEIVRVQGHSDTLYAVAVSPDGAKLATAGYDRDILLWDTATGEQTGRMAGHNGAVFDLAFDRSGKLLASAAADETIKLWRVADGVRLSTLPQPEGEQTAVLFQGEADYDENGETVAGSRFVFAAGADNRIRRWRLRTVTKPSLHPLQLARFAHEDSVTHLAVHEGDRGAMVVSASADLTVKVWNASALQMLASHGPLADVPASLAVSGDGIEVGLMDGQIVRLPLPQSTESRRSEVAVVEPVLPQVDGEPVTLREREASGRDALPLPVRVLGAIGEPGVVDTYRFEAKAGEQWVIEAGSRKVATDETGDDGKPIMADSPIDTVVEVRDADGEPIERVVLEAIRDSYFTFRGKNSTQVDDFRVHNWEEMAIDELFYSGGEVVRLWLPPDGPDNGWLTYPGFGKRETVFDTTAVAHALGEPAWIVRPHPPGTELPETGLPVFRLHYRNDDAGLADRGHGSRLTFTAPADGTYRVLVTDARGFGGEDYAYTLAVRPRRPDFVPTLAVQNWNEAKNQLRPGTGREIGLNVRRVDDFAGPVAFRMENLPDGITAPDEVVVQPGQRRAILNLFAESDAQPLTDEQAAAIRVVASAEVAGEPVEKEVAGLGRIRVDTETEPNVTVAIHLPEEDGVPTLRIRPGETKSMRVTIDRITAKGEVKFGKFDSGRNLPHAVFAEHIGLNGFMFLEGQDEGTFFITADPVAPPGERMWHLQTDVGGKLTSPSVRVIVEDDDQVASR